MYIQLAIVRYVHTSASTTYVYAVYLIYYVRACGIPIIYVYRTRVLLLYVVVQRAAAVRTINIRNSWIQVF